MAKNSDGDAVAGLMDACGFFQWENWAIDWSDLEPNWIVAEHDGKLLGCIQVVPAKPIGRMEILAVDPALGMKTKGAVVKKLTDHAIATNWMYGAQAVSSMIPYDLESYFGVAMNRDWISIDEGHMVMRRLC
jgi:N-acetylglutamate synthase-like GNAT family acetyltransferase